MKYLIPICVLLIGISSCQNKKGFDISGTVENQKEGEIYFVNLHTEKEDTVKIKNGKFNLSGVADEPTPFLIFSPDLLPARTVFFAGHGKTKINFTAKEPSTLKIDGCTAQAEYELFAKEIEPLLTQFDSIQTLSMAGKLSNDEMKQLAFEIQKSYEKINLDFIKNNPSSYVSALLSFEYLRQKPQLSAEEKENMISSLDENIQESHFGKKMQELIQANESSANELAAVGKPAPVFTLPNTRDKNISLEKFKGKYVLIDFWASWCGPCRQENPNVVAAFKKFRNKNFTVLGVSLDENKKQWEAAIRKDNLNWEQVSDLKGWNSSVVSLYNIKSIPSNVLVDPNGQIIAKDLRGVDLENQLSNILK